MNLIRNSVFGLFAILGVLALSGCSKEQPAAQATAPAVEAATTPVPAPAAAVAQAEPAPAPKPAAAKPAAAKPAPCNECGVVVSVNTVEEKGKGYGGGAVLGAAAGGLLGNQVGQGAGKDAATVVGVVGGAVAGHKIEEKMRSKTFVDIGVKMEDGQTVTVRYEQNLNPGVVVGDKVKVVNGQIVK